MRRLLVPLAALALLALPSCSAMADFGRGMCRHERELSAEVDATFAQVPIVGRLIGKVLTTALGVVCEALNAGLGAPEALANEAKELVGLGGEPSGRGVEGPNAP
jgi:hypothetical protein